MQGKPVANRVVRNVVILLVVSSLGLLTSSTAAFATDTGVLGSDDGGPTGPTIVAKCGGNYDNYIGQVGYGTAGGGVNTIDPVGTSFNQTNEINQAYNNFEAGHGVGVGAAFYLSGVALSGLTQNNANAKLWGEDQGAAAELFLAEDNATTSPNEVDHYTMNLIYADVEATDSEWSTTISYNQQVWDGFYQYLEGVGINVGGYSTNSFWNTDFSNLAVSQIEWTSQTSEPSSEITTCPGVPFAQFSGGPDNRAIFWGGESPTSNAALSWQWALGTAGDWDQIDITHYNSLFGTSYHS
jgi:hypothetical protein